MPRKSNRGGTETGNQSETQFYKTLQNYKKIIIIDDDLSKAIKDLYDNNIWNLKTKF